MPVSLGTTSIQDNSKNLRSVSINEREFIVSSILNKKLRLDGRILAETRPLILNFHRASSSSSSITECLVYIGQTKVQTAISCDLAPPVYIDRPAEGSINIKVDLSPMANIGFSEMDEYSSNNSDSKSYYSQRIHRILERILKERASGCLDAESLCVLSGKAVWKLNLTLTVLDDDGNLVDCSLISAMAALRFMKLPATEIIGEGQVQVYSDDDRDPIPLPLHHTPLPISFALFSQDNLLEFVIDPNQREELLAQGIITFCFNKHKELCCIDFSAGCSISRQTLNQYAMLAQSKVGELSNLLEDALAAAEQKSLEDRLKRMHDKSFLNTPSTNHPSSHFFKEVEGVVIEVEKENAKILQEKQKYQMQALDFDHLHQPVPVKEKSSQLQQKVTLSTQSSSLLEAMAQSSHYEIPTSTEAEKVKNIEKKLQGRMSVDNSDDDDEEEVVILRSEFS